MSRSETSQGARTSRALTIAAAMAISMTCGGSPTAPPPVTLTLACPANVQSQSEDGNPVAAMFAAPQPGGGSPPVMTSCSMPSGAQFPVGPTTVTCQASDSGGRSASCSFLMTVLPPPRLIGERFVCFGDSLTAGVLSASATLLIESPPFSYPAILQSHLTARYRLQMPALVNEGIPGERAVEGVRRFRSVLLQHRPQNVLLMEGTNDLLDRESAADAALGALELMVIEAKNQGIQVGLATIPPQRSGGPRNRDSTAALVPGFNDRIRSLAAAQGAALIDVYAAMKDNLSLIGIDDLHPTMQGYEVMAGVFFDAIKARFEERSPGPQARAR
jgi:lysophospholipase L1-like esterase